MKKNEKIFTTYYAQPNFKAVILDGNIKVNIYSEDGHLIEEKKIDILLEDGSVKTVDVDHIRTYENESDLPEFFEQPTQVQSRLNQFESKLADQFKSKVFAKLSFSGQGLKDITREVTGTRLEVSAYADAMKNELRPLGYTGYSMSSQGVLN